MTETRFTPEEFARLLALSPDHPDRRRVEDDPRFDSWRRMLRAFETGEAQELSASELRDADRSLALRLEREIGVAADPRAVRAAGGDAARTEARRSREARPGAGWSWLFPRWAPAMALAAVAVVAGGVWINSARQTERVVRGEAGALTLTQREIRGGRELTWSAVPGADEYRVVFFGSDLRERARVEHLTAPALVLRPEALPSGLERGAEVAAQVTALRAGNPVAESRTITLTLP